MINNDNGEKYGYTNELMDLFYKGDVQYNY